MEAFQEPAGSKSIKYAFLNVGEVLDLFGPKLALELKRIGGDARNDADELGPQLIF
jgi:hypothetical protein